MNNVYPPSEDSELLLDAALKEIRREDEVLEVGVGSGFISSQLLDKCKLVIATDISPFAVKEAKSRGIEVIRTDIARGIRKKFTLILFNSPYLELEEFEKRSDWFEKAINGGKNGIEVILRFLDEIGELLAKNGRIILVVSSLNANVFEEIENRSFKFKIIGRRKLFFEELFALRLFRD
jgi:release factor glutamine methyltransferase